LAILNATLDDLKTQIMLEKAILYANRLAIANQGLVAVVIRSRAVPPKH